MSITVENNLKNTENKEVFEQRAHFIPCKVDDDGPANVKKYFEPYVIEKDGDLTASFRGHPLNGRKVPVPEGYSAIVVTEAKRPLAEDAERKFQVAGGFKEFINWNWDKQPSQNDNIIRAMDWIDISEAESNLQPLCGCPYTVPANRTIKKCKITAVADRTWMRLALDMKLATNRGLYPAIHGD